MPLANHRIHAAVLAEGRFPVGNPVRDFGWAKDEYEKVPSRTLGGIFSVAGRAK